MAYKYDIPVVFPSTGGKKKVTFNLSCSSEVELKRPTPNWITIDEWNVDPDGQGGKNGSFTMTVGASEQGNPQSELVFKVNNQDCEDKTIKVKQDGVGCLCNNLVISNPINTMPPEGLDLDSIIANYTITGNCPKESYTATLTEGQTQYSVILNNNNVVLKTVIDPIPFGGSPKTFTLQFYYNNVTQSCPSYTIVQSSEICDCEHADSMVKMFKQTFTNRGTNNKEFLIGSGETYCGYLIADCCSDMLQGGDTDICENPSEDIGNIRTERLEVGEDGKYRFNFWGIVKQNQGGTTRSAGVRFTIVDKDGHEIATDCNSSYEITQSTVACDCGTFLNIGLYEDLWKVVFDDGAIGVKYDGANTKVIFRRSVSSWDVDTSCKWYYVEYDEDIFEVRTPNVDKHWWSGRNQYFDVYLKPSVEISENTEYSFTITEYVDAKVTDGNLVYGYPCSPDELKVLIFIECTCEIENHAVLENRGAHDVPYYINIGSAGGSKSIDMYLYCAEDGYMTLDFDGKTPWATIEEGADGKWIINYETNTGPERYAVINVTPIIDNQECESKFIYKLDQEKGTTKICRTCEEVINDISVRDLEYSTACTSYWVTYIQPFEYRGNCTGNLVVDVIGSSTETPLSNIVPDTSYLTPGIFKAINNNGDSDWKFTMKATFSTIEGDYCIEREITIKPCYERCECSGRQTRFSFEQNPAYPNGTCFPSDSGPYDIGEVGDIYEGEPCLRYIATTTEQEISAWVEGKIVKMLVNHVESDAHVSIVVNLVKWNGDDVPPTECERSDNIVFDIKPNCN